MLLGKKVLLGISGSIAAYKCPHLVRLLVKAGAEVKVVMTPSSKDFVTPMTLATVSGNPVHWAFADDEGSNWNNHVELGLWADLMLIAPATSNTLSKMASATCDNLLLATYLSAKCPVYVAPAMDLDMYKHPANRENLSRLEQFGHVVIPAEHGELASGLVGQGRMAEPEHVVEFLQKHLSQGLPLSGKKVLLTAGPTHEPLDPVRFIGNKSSGKMGVALARQAMNLGAEVHLILGPTAHVFDLRGIDVVRVTTAEEMYSAAASQFDTCNIAVFSAAVADYKPAQQQSQKIKKTQDQTHLELVPTVDILATLSAKKTHQVVVGFALETQDAENYAMQKLAKKNLDFVVLNVPSNQTGFGTETNQVKVFSKSGDTFQSELKSKDELAYDLWKIFCP